MSITPHGGETRPPELVSPLLGYALARDIAQGAAFAFAGTPVTLLLLRAMDLATHPPQVQADITVAGAWPFVASNTGTWAISEAPSDEKVTWTVSVTDIVPVYGAPNSSEQLPVLTKRDGPA